MLKMKIKKGDEVIVTTGKDKGKKGKVIKTLREERKVLIEGINLASRHTKPSQFSEGGIIKKELPVHISNVAHIDPKSGTATKVGYKHIDSGKEKVLVAKKSGEIIKREGK